MGSHPRAYHSPTGRLKAAAWLEYRVAKGYSEGASLERWTMFNGAIPGWFISHELGFSWESGPSILATLTELASDREALATGKRRGRRETAAERQARIARVLGATR